MTKINIYTFNVNGMRSDHKRLAILNFLKAQKANFILLQETHTNTSDEWKSEWPGKSVWSPGSSRSRGCAILVGPGSEITYSESDPGGRYILAKAKVEGGDVFNLVCVYAPDKPVEREPFFTSLKKSLVKFCRNDPVIMAGDLNFVNDPERDRIGSNLKRSQFTKGKEVFDQIVDYFELIDTHLKVGSREGDYTWSNKRGDIKSRLDRVFVSESGPLSPVSLTSKNTIFSDHKVLRSIFQHSPKVQRGKGYWKLNTAILKEMSYKVQIRASLATELEYKGDNLAAWWDRLKAIFRSDTIRESKKRAFRMHQREEYLQEVVNSLTEEGNLDIQRLVEATDELRDLRLEKARGAQARSGQQLAEFSETPNSYFYAVEKARAEGKNMENLEVNGTVTSDQDKIRSEVHRFYKTLYTPDTPINRSDRNFFLGHISKKFPREKESALIEEITSVEVKDVIDKLANGKAPGIDGLPYEFYKEFRDDLSGVLAEIFNHSISKGTLTISQRHAVISLLPKKGDLTKLTNWRPVSLQCCDAKILSKILANRLKLAMGDLVSESQVCSVPGREIQDHLLLVRETIAMAIHKKRPLYIISLDQEKAFDRVDWEFMFLVMEKMGIPETFINYVKTFYTSPISVACVNGKFTEPIEIKRGVRQGCPLSMLLYALVAESIGNAIEADDQIQGALTPNGKKEVKKIQFADDTNGIVRNTVSIFGLFELFERYESGTGARICVHKTRGIAINHPGEPPCKDIPIQWNRPDTKILGVIFTGDLKRSAELNWEQVIGAVQKRATGLAKRSLSLKAKALMANTLLLSKAWHIGRVFLPDKSTIRRLDALVFPYIWQPNRELIGRINMKLPFEKGGVNLIPVDTQCIALQLQDFLKIGDDAGPSWVHFTRYWLGDRVGSLLKEWKKLKSNSLPKHVIGEKPLHHREILPHALEVFPKICPRTSTAQSIRKQIQKKDSLTETAVKARRYIQNLIPTVKICWKSMSKHVYGLAAPAKHCDIRFRITHNAILSNSNMARWQHTGRKVCPKCVKCGEIEDTLHVFLCRSFAPLRFDILNTLGAILEPGTKFVDLIFFKCGHPLVQSVIAETLHQMWSSRCKSQHEGKAPNRELLYATIMRNVKRGLSLIPNVLPYECQLFDARTRICYF